MSNATHPNPTYKPSVGWVERSDTHQNIHNTLKNYAAWKISSWVVLRLTQPTNRKLSVGWVERSDTHQSTKDYATPVDDT